MKKVGVGVVLVWHIVHVMCFNTAFVCSDLSSSIYVMLLLQQAGASHTPVAGVDSRLDSPSYARAKRFGTDYIFNWDTDAISLWHRRRCHKPQAHVVSQQDSQLKPYILHSCFDFNHILIGLG